MQADSGRILGNMYSRLFKGVAFTAMVPGILFLVPVSSMKSML
jgi:uncharacterized membrane protein YjjB (DUF3815 family)